MNGEPNRPAGKQPLSRGLAIYHLLGGAFLATIGCSLLGGARSTNETLMATAALVAGVPLLLIGAAGLWIWWQGRQSP